MAQIPGIYVEIKGDSTQLAKDMRQAKQVVSESAKGMSNALNNALSGSQVSKGTNQLINSLGTLSRASKVTGQAFESLGMNFSRLEKVTGITGSQFQQLQAKMLQTAGARAQQKALADIARAADLTEREIGQLGRQFGLTKAQIAEVSGSAGAGAKAFTVFGGAVKTAISFLSIGAIVEFGRAVVNTGIQVDGLKRSFEAITGGAQAAQREFEFLRQTATKTGQNFYALTDSYRQLAASTQGTKLAGEETRKVFQSMSEAAAVLGMSNEKLELSLKAFAQMAGKGVVQMEELKGQLGDSLPGAVNIAAQAMGVSVKRLMEMSAAGELLAEDLLPKMADQLHKMYGEAANTAALESGIAAVNRFNQAWTDLKANLFDNKIFTSTANYFSWVLEQYNSLLKADSEILQVTERLKEAKKELADNREERSYLDAPFFNMFNDGAKADLDAKIAAGKKGIEELELRYKQLQNAADPAVQKAVESGLKMTDAWVTAGNESVDAITRAQEYESKSLIEQSKAEEDAAKKSLEFSKQRAEEQQRFMSEMTDMIKTSAMTQTEVELYELQKRKAAYMEAAAGNIALQKQVTQAYAAEQQRLTMLIEAGIDKRTAAEWESLEKLEDGWLAFNEGKTAAAERAGKEVQEAEKETTNVMIDEWSNALESIQSSLANMIYEFDFSMDSILDIFKRMLAEMLAAIAMSGIKDAFLGLFGEGEWVLGGLIDGIKGFFSPGDGKGIVASITGALGLEKLGSSIAGALGLAGAAGGTALVSGITGTATLGAIAPTAVGGLSASFGAVAPVAAATPTASAASGGMLSSLLGGGGLAALGTAVAGIGAVVGIISLLGKDSLPPVIAQLNEMHVTAQQISATGLTDEIGNVTAGMQEMVPALRNVALASWDASTSTLSVQSAFDSLHASMESGSETILQTQYQYNALTGTWSASLNVIDGYRQSLYDSILAADEAAGAVQNLGAATQSAAAGMAGAANSLMDILGSARQTMVTSGMDGLSYHAAGGIFTGATRIGSHVFGEAGPEAIVPLPYGPDSFEKLFDKIDKIGGGTPIIHVYIGNEKIDARVQVVADRLDADRDPLARGRRYIG